MEEEKAAAYYNELTQKGSGAARFKQGLGFSSAATTTVSDDPPPRGSALPTSSFLSNFVKASSPSQSKLLEHQSQIQSIQNKLKKREITDSIDRKPPFVEKIRVRVSDRDRDRSRSRERERRRYMSRSSSRERESRRRRGEDKDRDRDRDRRRRSRSRSRSPSRERKRDRREKSRSRSRERGSRRRRDDDGEMRGRDRRRYRSSSRERRRDRREKRSRSYSDEDRRDRRRGRGRSRSLSPRGRKSEKRRENDGGGERKGRVVIKEGNGVVDYAKLIDGFDKMKPAEKVKAKMKLQLSQTAEKDEKMGAGSQWERFDFDKDAPIEDEVLEAANDDADVSKRIGQSFRFASLEGKREDDIRNAHDEAMFGVPAPQISQMSESENVSENDDRPNNDTEITDANPACSLLSEKVLSKQQGSWRDRARRNVA